MMMIAARCSTNITYNHIMLNIQIIIQCLCFNVHFPSARQSFSASGNFTGTEETIVVMQRVSSTVSTYLSTGLSKLTILLKSFR